MATKRLSATVLEKTKIPEKSRVEFWDEMLPGFGVRMTKTGSGSFFIMYRAGGKQRRQAIGRFPVMKLDEARELARLELRKVAEGRDPAAEFEAAMNAPVPTIYTFRNLGEDFIAKYAMPRNRTWKQQEDILRRYCSAWDNLPATDITKAHIREVLAGMTDRGKGVAANRVLALLKTLFTWAVDRDLLPASPTASVKRPTKETSRDRILTDAELTQIWLGMDESEEPMRSIGKLLVLTAARRKEVCGMRWADIDLKTATWLLPADMAKNGRAIEIPLSAPAVRIIERVPKIARSEYLFPAQKGAKGHFSSLTRARRRLQGRTGTTEWTTHDLRRTCASGLARLGVAPHVIEACLNHQGGIISGVAAVYNRHRYDAEKRVALEAWAAKIERLLTPPGDNVVPLRA